ncbi:MAG: MOSC domain-containing protein [Bdellovibrio bacteriovorus]
MTGPLGLLGRFPRDGQVAWIGVRPARRAPTRPCGSVIAVTGAGLAGDHYAGDSGARGITLIQAEHLPVIAALAGLPSLDPAWLRRNLVISGINLIALKGIRFRVGEALLEGTGPCHPCSRMEEVLGPGGLNAMRGHGGLNARVLCGGLIRLGDRVGVLDGGVPGACGGS